MIVKKLFLLLYNKYIYIFFTVIINNITLTLDMNSNNSLTNDHATFLGKLRMATKESYGELSRTRNKLQMIIRQLINNEQNMWNFIDSH